MKEALPCIETAVKKKTELTSKHNYRWNSDMVPLVLLRKTCIIFLLRELKIGTSGNVKYKCNNTENFNVENLLNVRKGKTMGPLGLLKLPL
jgi:hypothetical protein